MTTDQKPGFDEFAGDYDAALMRGVSLSGESKEFFARGRLAWLRRCFDRIGFRPARVLDFGCGTGSATPYFFSELGVEQVTGVDVSAESIAVARREHGGPNTAFHVMRDLEPAASFDVVFCNGVFHHIPLAERARCIDYVAASLRPGGWFAFWENNPWNPGTHLVMARIPFDRDAIKVSPPEAVRLVKAGGLRLQSVTYRFFFPAFLGVLRPLENGLSRVPFGAQYQVLAQRSERH